MKVVALAGGVGGAKMADGLARVLPAEDLTIIVNTGDDFNHFGLRICPDLDTVCYTLAGLANSLTGWGRSEETWNALDSIRRLGGPDWFQLGDKDLGTHLERTRRLSQGEPLSKIVRDFSHSWGIAPLVLPMSDQPVETWVETQEMGWLPFQEYFVAQQCQPRVKKFAFKGVEQSLPAPGVLDALEQADCLVICPSNPWVSIAPILNVPGIKESCEGICVRVAVSPIVGGKAIKGPAAKMYEELGIAPSVLAVAESYRGLIDGLVIDAVDNSCRDELEAMGIHVLVTKTVMQDYIDRMNLAKETLEFCQKLMLYKGRQ
ncbi:MULTISPECIES: 2-phospho-L-lactate transferase [Anaerolinea]|uniref:LPPG:FO 2-phospho-L-lactate transferase n=1 Tax=Anaerolinea thermophila (strain DSM 14523 / JCM 11388 / NBRC 100420 / UNI-1) TaxID=926569 RepID=E8N4V7_ANATU|nr:MULTISPECIES: 2-phospho-L-lactate transferase [Anaerolinea]BAJ63471.1 LPPG:FO 2-phospho-L-lactate transferase [Anaerolinea thermophila UNI-1]